MVEGHQPLGGSGSKVVAMVFLISVILILVVLYFWTMKSSPPQDSRLMHLPPSADCPGGEIVVTNRWQYAHVGFCNSSADARIVVRSVDMSGQEKTRRFSEESSDRDIDELLLWVARLQQISSELGMPPPRPMKALGQLAGEST